MSAFDVGVIRQKISVTALDNACGVAQPFRYLVKAYACGREKRSESVAHSMGCNPVKVARLTQVVKWSAKIVAVTVAAVLYLGLQHEGFTQVLSHSV